MTPRNWITEISAAPSDLGTFLPLCLGLVVIAGMDPVGLLFGFGIFAIATALIYRRPIPVQPMKAVAAMGISGLAGPEVLIATGCLLGLTLIILSKTDAICWMKRLVPNTVLFGLRVALAISLVAMIGDLPISSYAGLVALLLMLVFLLGSRLKVLASVTTVIVGWLIFGDLSGIEILRFLALFVSAGLYYLVIKWSRLCGPCRAKSWGCSWFMQLGFSPIHLKSSVFALFAKWLSLSLWALL